MLSGLENPVHLLILGFIVLLVFGPKRLPELGRSLGSGIRHFRDSVSGGGSPEEEEPSQAIAPASEPAARASEPSRAEHP
jgi:sec-independent protein translocase protein TatA